MKTQLQIPKEDAMLVDVQYVDANRKANLPDVLYLVWKDLTTLEKHVTVIPEPKVDIYFEKPEYRNHMYPKNYAYLTQVDKVTVPYKGIISAIINDGGDALKEQAKDIYATKRYQDLKEFLKYRYVYGADLDIKAYYRFKWNRMFDNDKPKPISKAFCDIEVDFLDVDGPANPVSCPIDLVTLIDNDKKISYTFALIGREYKERDTTYMSEADKAVEMQRREYHKSRIEQEMYLFEHQEEVKKELHEMFDDSYGTLEYKFYFYKDEAKMLVHLFDLIHREKYDFVEFWNFEFDVNYIMERAKYLGLDPRQLFCHPDFPVQNCYFKKDNFHFDIKNKTDYFFTTGYTNFVCQMRIYAAVRKGRSELRSFSLNYTGKDVLGDSKLDYSEIGAIKYFSYRNYWKYFIYNIKDVLLQMGIENQTNDLEEYYATALENITPYDSVFKQTVVLRNYQYLDYADQGLVPGENQNTTPFGSEEEPEDDDEDFDFESKSKKKKKGYEGALVADPRLNDYVGMPLYGDKPTNNIFSCAIDMDMSAFYPNTIMAHNIDASCLEFKCILPASQFDVLGGPLKFNGITHLALLPDAESDFHDDMAKECFDNFQTKNALSTGHKWLNLPTIEKLYKAAKKELG